MVSHQKNQHRPYRRWIFGRRVCRVDGQSWPCSSATATTELHVVTPLPAAPPLTTVELQHRSHSEYVLRSPRLRKPLPITLAEGVPAIAAAEFVMRQSLGELHMGPWRIVRPGLWRAEVRG